MSLKDRIEHFRTNNEKRRIIREINKNKNYDKNIGLIIHKYLDDNDLLKIVLDRLYKIDEFRLESIIRNVRVDVILNNEVLFDKVCNYYSEKIKKYINNNSNLDLNDNFNILIENDKFKNKINEILDIDSIGKNFYSRYLNSDSWITNFDKVSILLSKLGFKMDDDYIYNALINSNYRAQNKLMQVVTINENIVDRLYKYKFESLKNWIKNKEGKMPNFYISKELVPSSDNEFANYWREQSLSLGEDALEFVFDKIKDFSSYDIFSEKSREQIYNEWYDMNGNIWNDPNFAHEAFNTDFNLIAGRLFDNKGIPAEYLFSNEYSLHLTHEILYYNYCGDALNTYTNVKLDYKIIRFLINNIDKISNEYKFIIDKLKELEQIDDIKIREQAQKEFLLIMTDGYRIIHEEYRLYDENGFNDNFYNTFFYKGNMEYIDYYNPNWKDFFNDNELIWMEKYRQIYDIDFLCDIYKNEEYDYIKTSLTLSSDEIENKYLHKNYSELISYYFTNGKPNRRFALAVLLDVRFRYKISEDEDLYTLLDDKQKNYYDFLKIINFDNNVCFNSSEIEESGKSIRETVLFILLNVSKRYLISRFDKLIQFLTLKEKLYFMFLEDINFDNSLNFNSSEIEEYFDEKGLTNKGFEHILNDCDIIYNMNQQSFKSYYEKNYNILVFQDLLKIMDNSYYYLSKFLFNTLNINLPIREDNIEDINKLYCLDILEPAKMFEIIKYIFYSDEETRNELSKIIRENKFSIIIKLFSKLSPNLNIEDLIKIIKNYNKYQELYFNLYKESEFNDKEKTILYSILINGDISASELIKNRDDLNNYSKIKYNKNNEIINTSDIMFIKSIILSNLFNIDLTQVRKILDKYNEDLHFSLLKANIYDDKLKEVLNEYDTIIEFISSIFNSNDLKSLKIIANNINENYKDNNIDMFFNLWNAFSKMDSDIMRICGSEINEKITIFNELLDTNEEDIPIINGEKAFIISNVNVGENFEYDGKKINKDANVQMIELNGIPFVSLGHVLNAYGDGGKLSDFNHPRLIGRTHLCLTGIDDNYYNLVKRGDRGIDYVQVLFDNLPSESLVIASSKDVSSYTHNNSTEVNSHYTGSYQPIRKIITETYHGNNGYNEYVYYRQYSEDMQSLRPSAILIRGENPSKSEIQAAAYLNVPLIKINKEKYPIRIKEEMEQRDIELKDFYQKLYEYRKSKLAHDNLILLQNLRQQLMNYYVDDNSFGRRVG